MNEKVENFLLENRINEETTIGEDEDDDANFSANVDANFSAEKTRQTITTTTKYHTTPDGEKIPLKALHEFMRQLR